MDWVFYLGLILLIIGALALLGFKLLPIKKGWNIWLVVIGILIVTGIGASLWGGVKSLAVASPTPSNPDNNAYTYSVTALANTAGALMDENARVITIPTTYNTTTTGSTVTSASANFTIGVTDDYADMRSVAVTCSTPAFYQQNVSISDSTQYLIVAKDTAGLADIRVYDSANAYQRRTRSFLLGGESTAGQSVTTRITATIDGVALGKLNLYNSQDITCNVAGEQWVLRVQKTAVSA